MDTGVDLIFKIAIIGVITALLSQLLVNSEKKELGLMVSITGLVVVLFMVVNEINSLFQTIKSVFGL